MPTPYPRPPLPHIPRQIPHKHQRMPRPSIRHRRPIPSNPIRKIDPLHPCRIPQPNPLPRIRQPPRISSNHFSRLYPIISTHQIIRILRHNQMLPSPNHTPLWKHKLYPPIKIPSAHIHRHIPPIHQLQILSPLSSLFFRRRIQQLRYHQLPPQPQTHPQVNSQPAQ